jgi:hypothetical protein
MTGQSRKGNYMAKQLDFEDEVVKELMKKAGVPGWIPSKKLEYGVPHIVRLVRHLLAQSTYNRKKNIVLSPKEPWLYLKDEHVEVLEAAGVLEITSQCPSMFYSTNSYRVRPNWTLMDEVREMVRKRREKAERRKAAKLKNVTIVPDSEDLPPMKHWSEVLLPDTPPPTEDCGYPTAPEAYDPYADPMIDKSLFPFIPRRDGAR